MLTIEIIKTVFDDIPTLRFDQAEDVRIWLSDAVAAGGMTAEEFEEEAVVLLGKTTEELAAAFQRCLDRALDAS